MLSKIQILFIILLVICVLYMIKNMYYPKSFLVEGFTVDKQGENFKFHNTTSTIYDDFYANIYDDLNLDPKKINFEVNKCLELMAAPLQRKHEVTALDIGCGTGDHTHVMQTNGIKCTGVDISESMIKKSLQKYPKGDYVTADAEKTMSFQPGSYNLITCFYFTIYYMKNKQQFISNCYQWLKSGGILMIHVVNRKKFSPIINASDPIIIISPQNYSKTRITESVAEFNNFSYKAKFDYDEDKEIGVFDEYFKHKKNNILRQNEHQLYMPGIKPISKIATNAGFVLEETIDLGIRGYDYQYLLVFRRLKF